LPEVFARTSVFYSHNLQLEAALNNTALPVQPVLNKAYFRLLPLNNVKEMQQDQDGDRNPHQPENNCAAHFCLLFFVSERLMKQTSGPLFRSGHQAIRVANCCFITIFDNF
jgi:hypothetical protein